MTNIYANNYPIALLWKMRIEIVQVHQEIEKKAYIVAAANRNEEYQVLRLQLVDLEARLDAIERGSY